MARLDPNHMRLPCPPDRRADLIGEQLAALADLLDVRKLEAGDASSALGRAEADLRQADEADAALLAEAVASGEDDPGPVNATAASNAFAEAKRKAAGLTRAADLASQDLHRALLAADRNELVAALNDRAEATAQRARELLDQAHTETMELRLLRGVAVYLDQFPERGPGELAFDFDNHRRACDTLRGVIDAMAPSAPLATYGW